MMELLVIRSDGCRPRHERCLGVGCQTAVVCASIQGRRMNVKIEITAQEKVDGFEAASHRTQQVSEPAH